MGPEPKSQQRISVLLPNAILESISVAAAIEALPTRMFSLMRVRKALEQRHPHERCSLRRAWVQPIADGKLTFTFQRIEVDLLDEWARVEGRKSRADLIREILEV